MEENLADPRIVTKGPFTVSLKRPRRKPRLLPLNDERSHVTAVISEALHIKLEVLSLLEGRIKNEIVAEAIEWLLNADLQSQYPRSRPPSEHRSTFILTKNLKDQLDALTLRMKWSKSDTLALAIMLLLERRGIDPETDPITGLLQALKSQNVAERNEQARSNQP